MPIDNPDQTIEEEIAAAEEMADSILTQLDPRAALVSLIFQQGKQNAILEKALTAISTHVMKTGRPMCVDRDERPAPRLTVGVDDRGYMEFGIGDDGDDDGEAPRTN